MTPGIFFTLEAKELKAFAIEDVPQMPSRLSYPHQFLYDAAIEEYNKSLESCKDKAIPFDEDFIGKVKYEIFIEFGGVYEDETKWIPDFTKIYPVPEGFRVDFHFEYQTQRCVDSGCGHAINSPGEQCCFNRRFAIIVEVKREDKPKEEENNTEDNPRARLSRYLGERSKNYKEEEIQENLWEEVLSMVDGHKFPMESNFIKSKFHITRK